MAGKTIRVLLADDHPLVRAGIRATLTREENVTLVGEAINGDGVRRLCQDLTPDVLLLDIRMPGPPPAQTVAYLRQQCPDVKVLVLTAYDDDAYVRGLIGAGAVGYVLKDEAPETVVRAIRSVMRGDSWFSRAIVEKLAQSDTDWPALATTPSLTITEHDILVMMAQGWDNSRIATTLSLAGQTVRNYTSRIYDKLGVGSRAEAIVWARERGLL